MKHLTIGFEFFFHLYQLLYLVIIGFLGTGKLSLSTTNYKLLILFNAILSSVACMAKLDAQLKLAQCHILPCS